MLSADEPPLNDVSDEQIQKFLGEMAPKVKELMEGVTLAIDYYKEGGYDREAWNRLCDGLAHEAMNLMMALSSPAYPYLARDCERAVREAAGITPREGGMREALQQQVGKGLLMSVLTVGRQTMVEPEEWPDELPATVLSAVRNSKRIKADPTMANLREQSPARERRRTSELPYCCVQFGSSLLSTPDGRVRVVPVCADASGVGGGRWLRGCSRTRSWRAYDPPRRSGGTS
ncbi:hypothetical protein ACFP1Z_32715 [Streptomyces gamaensis]|uniref:Uncharacterized protein n=1 Tax=Streptomyces gamaensis TaxID=1763542 RepID=A0ABW0ZF15_9ACTN